MQQDNFLRHFVIIGGGTAGWMAAAALNRVLKQHPCQVTGVESSKIATAGAGEASIPLIRLFKRLLDIDKKEFLRAIKRTFMLGIEFINWRKEQHNYFHPFGIWRRH
ncbi:hypothetical protein CA267_016740 [Alteromonas pelagimontana]|uniref:Tryptophan 7-halogenase n=1 Tax=Alteromonas pelagimontana TaxID=1858656 RepID=A0A6M4MGN0_9ALTE|nr:tryptophan 7-halogenase [Alteromonas pelagimontana]QJR82279.1 hypothetical protein CA267_016740 [Alteromonas pelagimontana]